MLKNMYLAVGLSALLAYETQAGVCDLRLSQLVSPGLQVLLSSLAVLERLLARLRWPSADCTFFPMRPAEF